jgi:hypothetical protein
MDLFITFRDQVKNRKIFFKKSKTITNCIFVHLPNKVNFGSQFLNVIDIKLLNCNVFQI